MGDLTVVTGGTGTLGSVVVELLRQSGQATRIVSRHGGPDTAVADLRRGIGLSAALGGADTVIHCATGRGDVRQTAHLVGAAGRAGVAHLVYISIVGVDRHPFAYYRAKFRAEQLIAESGVPFTILRATQFHNLVAGLFAAQRGLPALFVPDLPVQPVEVREVAARLVALSQASFRGRADDLAGPEIHPLRHFAAARQNATGAHRPIVPLRLPGKVFRAFRSGVQLNPAHAEGTVTFEQFLAARQAASAL